MKVILQAVKSLFNKIYSHIDVFIADTAAEISAIVEKAAAAVDTVKALETTVSSNKSRLDYSDKNLNTSSSIRISYDGGNTEGMGCIAAGYGCSAVGNGVAAFGYHSVAKGDGQTAIGKHNSIDDDNKYAFIVGNGNHTLHRSNAHTLDWNGNAWFAGTIEGTAMILTSPSGKRFKVTVDDSGALSAAEVTS